VVVYTYDLRRTDRRRHVHTEHVHGAHGGGARWLPSRSSMGARTHIPTFTWQWRTDFREQWRIWCPCRHHRCSASAWWHNRHGHICVNYGPRCGGPLAHTCQRNNGTRADVADNKRAPVVFREWTLRRFDWNLRVQCDHRRHAPPPRLDVGGASQRVRAQVRRARSPSCLPQMCHFLHLRCSTQRYVPATLRLCMFLGVTQIAASPRSLGPCCTSRKPSPRLLRTTSCRHLRRALSSGHSAQMVLLVRWAVHASVVQ
jgi:hypothetical protein